MNKEHKDTLPIAIVDNVFANVLNTIKQEHKQFVKQLHYDFMSNNFNFTIENKAAGFFVSYSYPETKKSAFNFYFRKNGLHVRLYPKHDTGQVNLTDYMVSEIDNQPNCKRLTKTGECNSKCQMGYEFDLRGKHYQKCRLCAFSFWVTEESKPVIEKWVKEEIIK